MYFEWTIYRTDPPTVGWYAFNNRQEKRTLMGAPQTPVAEFQQIIAGTDQAAAFERELSSTNARRRHHWPR